MSGVEFAAGVGTVFLVIGVLELFDRTSFALIALSSRAHALASWAGASTAFAAVTAIAVSIGAVLTSALGPARLGWLRVAGGLFLIGYAAWLYVHPETEESPHLRDDRRSSFVAALATIFVLELGDTTMIFEVVFVATWGWLVVLVGGASALVVVAAWNVVLGRKLGARVRPHILARVVIVVLVVVGAVTVAYGLAPGAFPAL